MNEKEYITEMAQKEFDKLNSEDDIPAEYGKLFVSDFIEFCPRVATFNMGFMCGWDDRDEQADEGAADD